jgi:hypothetical protein
MNVGLFHRTTRKLSAHLEKAVQRSRAFVVGGDGRRGDDERTVGAGHLVSIFKRIYSTKGIPSKEFKNTHNKATSFSKKSVQKVFFQQKM